MIDFAPYIQSNWSWIILFVAALFVGMSKTGVQGLTILTVPLLAMTFGAKPSTELMLPVLCFADVIGVSYYRRQAECKYIVRLLPMAIDACAIPFVLMGAFFGIRLVKILPEREFRIFTTTVTIISVLVMLLV